MTGDIQENSCFWVFCYHSFVAKQPQLCKRECGSYAGEAGAEEVWSPVAAERVGIKPGLANTTQLQNEFLKPAVFRPVFFIFFT